MDTIVITIAYNAEKTIRETIKSILNQSYREFVYYIIDNGSTDRTNDIIKRFAKNDSRIVVVEYKENDIWAFFEMLPVILKKHMYGYVCNIDADDNYERDFLRKMLDFIKENKLDLAACGNNFIQAESNKVVGKRQVDKDMIISGEDFDTKFIYYHPFMRTIWAKVYSLALLRKMVIEPKRDIFYGGDTLFAMEAFRCSQKVGILAETLHNYYMSNKSASYIWNEKRLKSDDVLFETTQAYLMDKAKRISLINEDFLYSVYFYSIRDTLTVLLNSKETFQKKIEVLGDIIFRDTTQKMLQFSSEFLSMKTKKELLNSIAEWIRNVLEAYPLLQGLSTGGILYWRKAVVAIIDNDTVKILDIFKEYAERDIPKQYMNDYAILGSNLCAQLEYVEGWLFFKKVGLDVLIDKYQLKTAEHELNELEGLFPDDSELKEIRERLNDKCKGTVS